jgi:HD superfamily phosphohydrolase
VHDVLASGEPAAVLAGSWGLDPARVAALIMGTATDPAGRILHSLLSGPIDVDKMDYLGRDSLHAGVPYGRHFDEERLLSSLCLDAQGAALAITDKGRTAAEMLVFARYVMFSEVYWHHAVRSATAMLQRAVWSLRDALDPTRFVRLDDRGFIDALGTLAAGTSAAPLVDGLFGSHRRLFKRVASYDALRNPAIHRGLAGRTYDDKVAIAGRLAATVSQRIGIAVGPDDLLIDAPPAEREVEFRLTVRVPREGGSEWRRLEELSPVVRSLAHEQFDDLVKRVRIFAPAAIAAEIAGRPSLGNNGLKNNGLEEMILEAVG